MYRIKLNTGDIDTGNEHASHDRDDDDDDDDGRGDDGDDDD